MRLLRQRNWFRDYDDCHASRRERPFAILVLLLFLLVALLISRSAAAAVHPVPLDKNVDAAKGLVMKILMSPRGEHIAFPVMVLSVVCVGEHLAGDRPGLDNEI